MENKTMKALQLKAIGKLGYCDVVVKKPAADEVLIKVGYCGICASDIPRIYETGTYHFPTILGHEISGQVVALGEDVSADLLHKKVVVFPILPCKKCESCLKQEYATCENYNYFGSRCDGGFAEYLVVPVFNLVVVDDALPLHIAALCEPTAIAIHAIKMADFNKFMSCAIIGTGTIAFLTAAYLKKMGAKKIFMCGKNKSKLLLASKLGYEAMDMTESNTDVCADIVFECVGKSVTIEHAIKVCQTSGVVILIGNPDGDVQISKDLYWKILKKQISLKGTWNSSFCDRENDWEESVQFLTEEAEMLEHLITTYPLAKFEEALGAIRDENEMTIKVMLEI